MTKWNNDNTEQNFIFQKWVGNKREKVSLKYSSIIFLFQLSKFTEITKY